MLLLTLDEKDRKPQYQQILEQIRQKIEDRTINPGEKLPSTRKLADKLGIHRSTVASAYQELWALGFIDISPGSCPRVRERMEIATAANRTRTGLIDWNEIASSASTNIWKEYLEFDTATSPEDQEDFIDFGCVDIDSRLFPVENFRACLNKAVKEQGPALLGYGDRAGYRPLREYIARRLQSHGISVTAAEILLTNGAQQGIDLVLRMIASPEKAVAIESPTYIEIIPLLRFYGLKPLEVPVHQDGMNLAELERIAKQERPSLLYTMPNFQNPTGISTTQAHREKLLSLCEKYRIPILEDGFEEEMKYFGRVILPIKSMDKNQLVIYCGTFSKVLFPGVRIGWLAAEKECIDRLIAMRRFSELSSNMVLQAAMYEFCQNGYYERHISKMHRVSRKRMQTALRALSQYISPDWAEWSEPSGGYLLWLKLKPASLPESEQDNVFARHNVRVLPGNYFFSSDKSENYLRLSISTLNEEEIREGVRRLAGALQEIYAKN